jgi:hypothetical protein
MEKSRQRRVHNNSCARQRKDYPDVKPWVIAALAQEGTNRPERIGKNEPSAIRREHFHENNTAFFI